MSCIRVALVLCLSVPVPCAVSAQSGGDMRAVSGRVLDDSGAAVIDATVVLRSADAPDRQVTTDGGGRFEFPRVVPDRVTLIVTRHGFATEARDLVPPARDLVVVLRVLPVSEAITVTGSRSPDAPVAAASKTGTPVSDVPQALTIVTREFMADLNMQSMADVVRFVPGVGMAQGEGNRDTPIFRGNTSTSDFFVDGIRDDVQYFRDLYNVDRIEALKGPNAMLFGRGGGGGVINRVTRQAEWLPTRAIVLEGGTFGHRRATSDLGGAITRTVAARVNSLYENSDSYRRGVELARYGINPTASFALGDRTLLRVGYEHFHDRRTADRGVPSFAGRPLATKDSTFFGDPDQSESRVTVDALRSSLDHRWNSVALAHRAAVSAYDKFYQNVYPTSSVDALGTVGIGAYNNATTRTNIFNQLDVIVRRRTGALDHVLLVGLEHGRQITDNLRQTGFFTTLGEAVTSTRVTIDDAVTSLPVTFRPGVTDAANHGVATVTAAYAQDQVGLTPRTQVVFGVRYDRFDVEVRNTRTAATFSTRDRRLSPRAGMVFKPRPEVSLYTSYSVSFLPRAGEQLSSLSLTNQALDPETFTNYEVGAKWQTGRALTFSAAAYRLGRGNVVVPDPADTTRSLLVDGQCSQGLELDLAGRVARAWSVLAAYAWQAGEITRTQSAAVRAGARLAQFPRHAFSVWNKYEVSQRWSAGVGLIRRADVYASTDNAVILPAFTRLDGAVFLAITSQLSAQVNIENLTNQAYAQSANGNNNITPGSPRAVRFAVTTRF